MEDRDQEVKTGKTISATFAAVIVLALPSLLAAEPFSVKWQETPPITVQRGDLVMRRGRGMWTRFFIGMSTREKRFSHVGFVHSVSNGVTMLIHAEAEDSTGVGDVHLTPWPEFFKESSDCAIFRYDGERAVAESFAREATHLLGVPFDSSFDMRETNRLYCTEFVRQVVNTTTKTDLIGYTKSENGFLCVAIDDVYRRHFVRIFDAHFPCDRSGIGE